MNQLYGIAFNKLTFHNHNIRINMAQVKLGTRYPILFLIFILVYIDGGENE